MAGKNRRRNASQEVGATGAKPFMSDEDLHNMGFLFSYMQSAPEYIDQMPSEDLLNWLSVNLVEAGDKLHYLTAPDGLTEKRGPEVQRMSSVLCELGRFPKDVESLDILHQAMVSIRHSRGNPERP